MITKTKANQIVQKLKEYYPEAVCSLYYDEDPWRLLVMARLSAQCTDERVNQVCVGLFKRFPDADSMAKGDLSEIEELIKPCGLFRGKASSIKAMSAILIEQYGGNLPDSMEALLSLPGVGRKIANLILGDVFHKGGIVADTHCMRICGRLGFYAEGKKDPLLTEKVLTPLIPIEEQSDFCHRLVTFGREICTAPTPKCTDCPLKDLCAFHSSHHTK